MFIFITLGSVSKKILPQFMSKSVLAMLSSNIGKHLEMFSQENTNLKFASLIHVEFIFLYGVREYSSFILFACSCPVFLAPFIEETVFSPLYILASFVID